MGGPAAGISCPQEEEGSNLLSPTMVARQGHWVEGNCPARTTDLQRDNGKKVRGREAPTATATATPAPTVAQWRPVRTVV